MFDFLSGSFAAGVFVARSEEDQRKRSLAKRRRSPDPPRSSAPHSVRFDPLYAASGHRTTVPDSDIRASGSSSSSCSDLFPFNSTVADVLSLRPAVGRTVKPRKPRLAKGSHFAASSLRPVVPSHLRIAHWITPWSLSQLDEMRSQLPPQSIRRINEVAVQSWAHSTRNTQGAALLCFTEFCDELSIPETDRMPASSYLLSAFVSKHAGSVSASCVDGWMSSLHAWHTINNAPWKGGDSFVSMVKKGASKLAPPPKPPRAPVSLLHLKVLQKGLDMSSSFDAAVWAVATAAFWGCCRLGELTVEFDKHLDPRRSVTRAYSQVAYGGRSTLGSYSGSSLVFRIPWTKTTKQDGATLTIAGDDLLSPVFAMKNHLGLTKDASKDDHLFSYKDERGVWHPMVKRVFLARCEEIWSAVDMGAVFGHAFRIGGATELLLGGVPPHVVAMIGRWKSLTFLKYWRNVVEIITGSFSSSYDSSRLDAITKEIEKLNL